MTGESEVSVELSELGLGDKRIVDLEAELIVEI